MPFSHTPKNPGDLIQSEDWNNALDAISDAFNKFDAAAGHTHSGSGEDAPQIQTNGIADNAISSQKLQNRSVTLAKLASGVIKDIGIAVTASVSNNQQIPIPSGFSRSECVFFVSAHSVNFPSSGGNYSFKVDNSGKVTIILGSGVTATVSGMALAKKGGW